MEDKNVTINHIDFELSYVAFWCFCSLIFIGMFTNWLEKPIVLTDPTAQQIAACELINHTHQPRCLDKIIIDTSK